MYVTANALLSIDELTASSRSNPRTAESTECHARQRTKLMSQLHHSAHLELEDLQLGEVVPLLLEKFIPVAVLVPLHEVLRHRQPDDQQTVQQQTKRGKQPQVARQTTRNDTRRPHRNDSKEPTVKLLPYKLPVSFHRTTVRGWSCEIFIFAGRVTVMLIFFPVRVGDVRTCRSCQKPCRGETLAR